MIDFAQLGPYAAALAAVVGAWLTYRASERGRRASPYELLASRVSKLEEQVDAQRQRIERLEDEKRRLEDQQEEDREMIRRLVALIRDARLRVPFSLPAWLDRPPHVIDES